VETLIKDMRYGIRVMAKTPIITLSAIITLALSIGASSAIFSVVSAILLRPLPYPNPDRLMVISETNASKGLEDFSVSLPNFYDFKEGNDLFETLSYYTPDKVGFSGEGQPENVNITGVGPGFFRVLGITPALGSLFQSKDFTPGASTDPAIIISHKLWQSRLGGDPKALDKKVLINSKPTSIIGVMPEGFSFPTGSDCWGPIPLGPNDVPRSTHFLSVIGRLKPGVSRQQAEGKIKEIASGLSEQYQDTNAGWGARVDSLHDKTVSLVKTPLFLLIASVGIVMLISCVNVANILLAKGAARQKEIAICMALGAGRKRMIRQLLTESVLLALVGGIGGLLLAFLLVGIVRALSLQNVPRLETVRIDVWALVFTFGLSVLTGIIFGLMPALQASRVDLNSALKQEDGRSSGGQQQQRFRSLLLVSETALATVLLIAAGLLIKSFLVVQATAPGFNPDNRLTAHIALPSQRYATPAQMGAFYERLLDRVSVLPGVASAAIDSHLPMTGRDLLLEFVKAGEAIPPEGERPIAGWRSISPKYFETMGIPLIKGRAFTDQDREGSPYVVMVNESFARRYFPNEDALGKSLLIGDSIIAPRQIVGIVRDVKHNGLETRAQEEMYVPYLQRANNEMTLVLRTEANPMTLASDVRSEVQALDKDQPVFKLKSMDAYISDSMSGRRLNMELMSSFAGLALLLAAVGIYGIMSYSVIQRTRELGIRIALGAQPGDIIKFVMRHVLGLVAVGLAIGFIGAFAITRVMVSLIYGVSSVDPSTFILAPLVILIVAVAATLIPARKATRVDPLLALRSL
jgi:putative ABC transport system permease protein